MQSISLDRILVLCVLLFWGLRAFAAGNDEPKAKLFIRYEDGAGGNRLVEDVLTFVLSVKNKETTKVAIRVCSNKVMPFALVTAGADPFRIAELFSNSYAYTPDKVVFLRSPDCVAPEDSSLSIIELWIVPSGAELPPHDEVCASNEVRQISYGKQQSNRGVRDYKIAIRKLIQDLRVNPFAVGVVYGYFLKHPSRALQRRLREVTLLLQQSGLSKSRYIVHPTRWNNEVSINPPDSEPLYPSVLLVEAKSVM